MEKSTHSNWFTRPKLLTEEDKKRMKYFEIETRSHTGKSTGFNCLFAENESDARAKMKKKGLPVYSIREIRKP